MMKVSPVCGASSCIPTAWGPPEVACRHACSNDPISCASVGRGRNVTMSAHVNVELPGWDVTTVAQGQTLAIGTQGSLSLRSSGFVRSAGVRQSIRSDRPCSIRGNTSHDSREERGRTEIILQSGPECDDVVSQELCREQNSHVFYAYAFSSPVVFCMRRSRDFVAGANYPGRYHCGALHESLSSE